MKIRRYISLAALLAIALCSSLAYAYVTVPSGHSVLQILTGTKTVAAAATPETLTASNAYVVSVLIEPATTTQGPCYVGAVGYEHIQLPASIPGYIIQGSVINLKTLSIKVATDGDAVKYTALYR